MNHRTTAFAVAVCGLLATAEAAAAGPQAGKRYDGTNTAGDKVFVVVDRSGTRVARSRIMGRVSCSDGKTRQLGQATERRARVRIDAQGSFSNRVRDRFRLRTRGGSVRGMSQTHVSATFGPNGDVVTGTIRSTFRSRRLRCGGDPTPFSAYLNGTPQAPFRDATLATGAYTGRARGARLKLRMFTPAREAIRGTVAWRTTCRSGARFRATFLLRHWPVEGDRLTVRSRHRRRIEEGIVGRERTVLRVTFSNRDGRYVMRAFWWAQTQIFRNGRHVDTCRFSQDISGGLS